MCVCAFKVVCASEIQSTEIEPILDFNALRQGKRDSCNSNWKLETGVSVCAFALTLQNSRTASYTNT